MGRCPKHGDGGLKRHQAVDERFQVVGLDRPVRIDRPELGVDRAEAVEDRVEGGIVELLPEPRDMDDAGLDPLMALSR